MESFLSKVVTQIVSNEKDLQHLTIILPSQRSCVFLKEIFKNKTTKATFLPKIVSIENFIQEKSGFKLIDNTQLIFEFYAIYSKISNTTKDSFEVFSQWARTLLQDFNEIDAYLIETDSFFATLKATSRLNNWFTSNESPTALTSNYISFFENIETYYVALYKHLKKNKSAYQGLLYREAVLNLQQSVSTLQDTFYFVGFNALNKAEETIFQTLLNSGKAIIYWDEVVNNFGANTFINKYKKWSYYQNNPFLTLPTNTVSQDIKFVGTPKNVAQFKYVAEILSKQENNDHTALILANEALLPLALNSLPRNVEKLNITMGFPLQNTPFKSLFDLLFKLHLNREKFHNKTADTYYYKDVIHLFNQPHVRNLFTNHPSLLFEINAVIQKTNIIFLNYKTLEGIKLNNFINEKENIALLLKPTATVADFIAKCLTIITHLKTKMQGIEKEMLFHFNTIFTQLYNLDLRYQNFTNLKILYSFYKQYVQQETLSFRGEPLEGLQLMGLLETRALDFETVILTSANEGILPKGKSTTSFIPFDVKKHFHLPTYHDKDAIFSYHFYRLIKRAKKIVMVYNTETDDFGQGEKSRFLTQMNLTNKKIQQYIVTSKVSTTKLSLQEIHKSDVMMDSLKSYASKGISPSALANYIYNPLVFYTQKVLGIKEHTTAEETIAANTLGNVIHDALDALYKPYKGFFLRVSDIHKMKKLVETHIHVFFKKHYLNGDISIGKNKLIVAVANNFIIRFLNQEAALLEQGKEIKILATELPLSTQIKIEQLDFPINIKGIIDRVDEVDGVLRIVDYKTGIVTQNDLKITDMNLLKEEYKATKAMQLLLYTYLYTQNYGLALDTPIECGIISFKNLKAGILKVNFSQGKIKETKINQEHMNRFITVLKQLISEIFDAKTPFIEKENPQYA